MKKIYIALTGLLLLFTSCNIYRYEEHHSPVSQPEVGDIITFITADLDISKTKISHTEDFRHNKYHDDVNIADAKEYTMSAALMKHNADVLVAPQYNITTNRKNNLINITVTGYPATFTNFRKSNPNDSLLLITTSPAVQALDFYTHLNTQQSWEIERRWQNSIFATWGLYIIPGLEYVGGVRFNKSLFLGFGVGVNSDNLVPFSIRYHDYYAYYSGFIHSLPLYAQFYWYFLGDKRVTPYIGISQGIDFRIMSGHYNHYFGDGYDDNDPYPGYHHYSEYIPGRFWIGSYTRGEIGLNFRLSPKTSFFISYDIGVTSKDWDFYDLYLGFRIGFTF